MKLHTCARGLLAGAISVVALAGGTGVAHADSDPFLPPGPGIIDQLLTSTPALFVDPPMKAVHQPTGVVSECFAKINLSDAGKQIARTYGNVR